MRFALLVLATLAALPAGGQSAAGATRPVVCTTQARYPVALTVRNEQGLVLAQVFDSSVGRQGFRQLVIKRDPLGTYTVSVGRQWYQPATLNSIKVLEDRCGPVRPTPVTITLQPTPDAPRIRQFSLGEGFAEKLFVGSWPFYQRYRTFLDAPRTLSRDVLWSSSDPTVATIDQTGMLRSVCSRTPGWTTITATLRADPTVKVSSRFGRGGGGIACPRGKVDR